MKNAERAKSPFQVAVEKQKEQSVRRRKISIGPIDFEQRREHIRLAYSRSIRESQALEARQRAADRRRQALETAARARAAASSNAPSRPPTETDNHPPDATVQQWTLSSAEVSKSPQTHASPNIKAAPRPKSDILEGDVIQTLAESGSQVSSTHLKITTRAHDGNDMPTETTTTIPSRALDSPTLGIPGNFPSMSPSLDGEEAPKSAISATSGVTEFDVEPQANPPVEDPPHSVVAIKLGESKSAAPQRTFDQVEYKYPFEDELGASNQPTTSQETLNHPSPCLSPHIRDPGDIPDIPGAFVVDDSECSHLACDVDDTSRPPLQRDHLNTRTQSTVPFPRLDPADESGCTSETDLSIGNEHGKGRVHEETTDACSAEDTDGQETMEDSTENVALEGSGCSLRASSCASASADDVDERRFSCAGQATADTSNCLPAPPLKENRSSAQSAWTEYTFDSAGQSTGADSPIVHGQESPSFGHVTIFQSAIPSRGSGSSFTRNAHESSDVRASVESNRSSGCYRHQLPQFDIGEDFSIPYLSPETDADSSHMPSPNYGPPPVPQSASGSALDSRRTSEFYDQSQNGSTLLNSGHESEDVTSFMETPFSTANTSVETPGYGLGASEDRTVSFEADGIDAKERERLMQRRNVIKELVDTEAVFVRDMNIVEEIYKGTAEACPNLDNTTIKLIFRNTDEIIALHSSVLSQLKEAVATVYIPSSGRSTASRDVSTASSESGQSGPAKICESDDRATSIGPVFQANMEKIKLAHESFLRNSDQAAKRLIETQRDPAVKLWLNECNDVAKDLTAAWDLDSLLIKPMQRITKYPNLITILLQHTPQDHPDRQDLVSAKELLETAILEINRTKKNFELVGQIVGRKRKESDAKSGFARAFGKRVDKLQASSSRPVEDPEYAKLNEKFGDDYLRLQVVLRDVEFYTRQVSAYVHEFLQYLSSIELVMRLQPGNYPEIESKWVQFNISARDLQKVALEEHVSSFGRSAGFSGRVAHTRCLSYRRFENM